MTLELVAVDGCTLGHSAGSTVSGGSFTITSIASNKVQVDSKGVYYGVTISFTFAGGNEVTCVAGSVTGSGTITATAIYTKVDNQVVLRLGDSGTMNWSGTNVAPPPPTNAGVSAVEITDAGQDKVKAE